MRAPRPTGRPSPLRRSRWRGPSVQGDTARKKPRSCGAFFVPLSLELPRLAARGAPAGAGLARRRRAASGAPAFGGAAVLRCAPRLRCAAVLGCAALFRGAALLGRAALLRGAPLLGRRPLRCAPLPRSGLTLAGPRGLLGRRLALAASAARRLHLGDAFLFLLLLFYPGLLAH